MRNKGTATITMLKDQKRYGFLLRQVSCANPQTYLHITERKAVFSSRMPMSDILLLSFLKRVE